MPYDTIIAPTEIANNVVLPTPNQSTFPDLALQYVNHWVNVWVPAFNTMNGVVYNNAMFVAAKAQASDDARVAAQAAQAAAETAAGAKLWVSGASYLAGTPSQAPACVYTAADPNLTFRCIANVSGSAVEPKNDPSKWVALRVTTAIVREGSINLGAGTNIDLSLGGRFHKTITANTTLTLSNVPAAGVAASFELVLTNPAAFALTLWPGIKRSGGVVPLLSVAGRDRLAYITSDGGTTWDETVIGVDVK